MSEIWSGSTEFAMSMSAGTGETTSNFRTFFDDAIFVLFSRIFVCFFRVFWIEYSEICWIWILWVYLVFDSKFIHVLNYLVVNWLIEVAFLKNISYYNMRMRSICIDLCAVWLFCELWGSDFVYPEWGGKSCW